MVSFTGVVALVEHPKKKRVCVLNSERVEWSREHIVEGFCLGKLAEFKKITFSEPLELFTVE